MQYVRVLKQYNIASNIYGDDSARVNIIWYQISSNSGKLLRILNVKKFIPLWHIYIVVTVHYSILSFRSTVSKYAGMQIVWKFWVIAEYGNGLLSGARFTDIY